MLGSQLRHSYICIPDADCVPLELLQFKENLCRNEDPMKSNEDRVNEDKEDQ